MQDSTFEIEGLEVQVLASESTPEAVTFVLVHGLGVAASYFTPLAHELESMGRVIAVNLPGFGPTADPDHTVRISQFARIAREAVSRVGVTSAIWVGHSMGTQVVVEAVAQDPSIAQRVVLLSPVVNARERRLPILAWRFARSAARESASSAAAALRALLGGGVRSFFRTLPVMIAYPIDDRIAQVPNDLVLITGELDETAPAEWLAYLAERAGGATAVRVVPDASHQAMYTKPSLVAQIIADAPTRH